METALKGKNLKTEVSSIYRGTSYIGWCDKVQRYEVKASKAFRTAYYANIEANVRKDMHDAVKDRNFDLTMETMTEMHKAQSVARKATEAFEKAIEKYDEMFDDYYHAPVGVMDADRKSDYTLITTTYSNFRRALQNIEYAGTEWGWSESDAPISTTISDWLNFHQNLADAKKGVRTVSYTHLTLPTTPDV